ncbi:glycosyltransferase family 2 protein [Mucilaginibacter glaciei]|uniref:Glycosyltransferase n=1 Tax=Mucilaginibacter glaciei TaxID=2772109 RepID=A0A926NV35_9SPHI|nr:glycosyltransferase family 2 protein [Mucilaginibacter glaciei]MBD1392323.1 glycosyltransferase [Mucilaginibacter glaciei]
MNIEMLHPKITIITVVYNGVNSIEKTIVNVLNLNYPNLDFIVVDGNSTDGTVQILNQYREKLTWLITEPDKGIYDAMNKGWELADNESYILFLGAGDEVVELPDMNLYKNAEVIYGDVELGQRGTFKSTVGWRSFLGNSVHHQAMLVKKSIHPTPPFSLEFKVYADFDFNQRLIKSGVKFLKDPGFRSYAMEGGVSEKIDTKESLRVVRKNYGSLVGYLAALYYHLQKV